MGNKHKEGVHFPGAFFPLYAGFFKFYYQGSIYINFLKCYFGIMHGNHHFIIKTVTVLLSDCCSNEDYDFMIIIKITT